MTGIIVSGEGPITEIRLARPSEGNALDLKSVRELEAAVSSARRDSTGVIVLASEGPVFCGGGDVAEMSAAPDTAAYTFELASTLHRTLLSIMESGLVLVVAVQGAAAGAGFGLVLNADYVVATEKATFLTAYSKLGVSPDGGTTHLLPRIVGHHRAADLTFAGRRLDAHTARDWGIVNDIVSTEELTEAARSVALRIAQTPIAALRATKRLLSAGLMIRYEERLAEEATSIAQLMATGESRELQKAFLTKLK